MFQVFERPNTAIHGHCFVNFLVKSEDTLPSFESNLFSSADVFVDVGSFDSCLVISTNSGDSPHKLQL